LPHIGTFAEVARTCWVRQAYEALTGEPTVLYAFSDDTDGLRKVPDNVPNAEMLREHLGKPLCDIPDPFGEAESYSGYMNRRLRQFLDKFGFSYEFKASHTQYRGGVFNDGLMRVLGNYDKIRDIVLPTLSPENRAGWSPFMPICQRCGKVYTTRVVATHADRGTISYVCDQPYQDTIAGCGNEAEISVADGGVKVGWKVDWALRWFTYGVDYEMYGKDLIDSAKLSGRICRVLGEQPPQGFFYEMFLDGQGRKISKSLGNGMTIDEWLEYGPLESLSLFIFKKPEQASRLHFDVVPQNTDEYLQHRGRFAELDEARQLGSPIWFLHPGEEVQFSAKLNYAALLNLVSVLNTDDHAVVWGYLERYDPDAQTDRAVLDGLIIRALNYYRDFVLPTKEHELPSAEMRPVVDEFLDFLAGYDGEDGGEIQRAAYAAGKGAGVNLREFFGTMYKLILGQPQGPRLGTFVALYGVENTLALAREKLRELS
jgi:lysyl-tRNA synthetase class 1